MPAERYLFWCFAPIVTFFAAVSWTMPTHVLWPLPCWLGITILMAGTASEGAGKIAAFYRRNGRWLAGLTGVLFLVGLVHLAFLIPGIPQPSPMHGWPAVARRTAELRSELPRDSFVMALGPKYFVPSQLAFHLRAPLDVYGRSPLGRNDLQFNVWTDAASLQGRDAVILVQKGYESEAANDLPRAFLHLERAGDLVVPLRGGKPMEFQFYRGRGYRPPQGSPGSPKPQGGGSPRRP